LKNVTHDINYLKADIAEWREAGSEEQQFEIIFHLAAFSAPSAAQEQPELAYRQNVMGTARMLEVARRCSAKKFIFTSAAALYTNIPKYLPIDEKHPIDPSQGIYAATKRLGELLCEDCWKNYGVPYVYFRLFNTYGPRQAPEYLVPSFIKQAYSTGRLTVLDEKIKRDFIYVGDVVDALIKGAEAEYCGGPINLGTGTEHSIGEVAAKIGSLLGAQVHHLNRDVFGPTRHVCNNTLAKQVLNWAPTHTLDEGLEITLRLFREGSALRSDNP
jgi:UDP-glucose 4-epimerase